MAVQTAFLLLLSKAFGKKLFDPDNFIVARKAFTVCVPSAAQAAMVDFAGMVSGAGEDKFSATGLTAVRSKVVDAPYVDECPLVLECELQATLELGSHTQFVGRILNVGIETDCLNESGQPNMYRIDPLLYDGGQKQYCRVGEPLGKAFSLGRRYGL